jgi:hypothetical protein
MPTGLMTHLRPGWSLQGAGTNFAFRISTSTTTAVGAVPEGGTTMALFGIGLAVVLFLHRQLKLT